MIVFRRLLRTSESNTGLYRGINYYLQFLNRDYSGLQRAVVRTTKSNKELYILIIVLELRLQWAT